MSRTVRRKNGYNKSSYLFNKDDVDENGNIQWGWKRFNGLPLKEANVKAEAWYHTCKGPKWQYNPGKEYRQDYRAKSKQQLREQLICLDDYEGIAIDKHCNDWSYW